MLDNVNFFQLNILADAMPLDGASRYAAVNKHFTEVSLTSPTTITVLVIFGLIGFAFLTYIFLHALKAKKEQDKLRIKAQKNSHMAKRKFRYHKDL